MRVRGCQSAPDRAGAQLAVTRCMTKRMALWVVGVLAAAGCESGGGHGGGGGFAHSGGGGGHSWGESSSSSSSSSSHSSSSSSSSRPSLASSSSSSSSSHSRDDGLGNAVAHVLPTVAEALIVGNGDYTVDLSSGSAEPTTDDPMVDPCESCPLEDACGTCIGFGHAACRENMGGFMSRCESSVAPHAGH